MDSCNFCKIKPREPLKNCVCGKASYCSKDCQIKDWKSHKPSCPPFVVRESPGKGRGLFATRKIMEGQVILEELPLFTHNDEMSPVELLSVHIPNIDEETKAKILELSDPAENLKSLEPDTVEELTSKEPVMMFWKKAKTDEASKIFRIFTGNAIKICGDEDLYDTTECGLYYKISLINHACVPNATVSWVMGDFQRHQVRAMMAIEKNEEILISYRNKEDFIFRSKGLRRQQLLELRGFLCQCSECSLEGEDLEDNEKIREEYWEKNEEINHLMSMERSDPRMRKALKKVMKLAQRTVKLVKTLNLRAWFVTAMIGFYHAATLAGKMEIPCDNDPEVFRQEALKYARMFGDNYIHLYNKSFNN